MAVRLRRASAIVDRGSSRAVQSVISNSRFSFATMTERVELHCSRSDFPNLTPLTAQFAWSDVFRATTRSTMTPDERLATAAGFFHRRGDRTFQDDAFNSVPSGRLRRARYWIERENLHVPSQFTGENCSVACGDGADHRL